MAMFSVVTRGGDQIYDKGEDPEGEDESHNPFENGCGLAALCEVAGDKGNGEDD